MRKEKDEYYIAKIRGLGNKTHSPPHNDIPDKTHTHTQQIFLQSYSPSIIFPKKFLLFHSAAFEKKTGQIRETKQVGLIRRVCRREEAKRGLP